MDLLITNGSIVTSSGIVKAHIGIEDEKIVSLSKSVGTVQAEKHIDAKGLLVFPGIIDSHVHFQLQDMGKQISTDTFSSGTKAAAFGGVTTIIDFADQTRGRSAIEAFNNRRKIADPEVVIDYGLHVSLTDINYLNEVPQLVAKGVTSFKMFTTYSWRNLYLNDAEIYETMKVIRDNGAVAVVHCENDDFVVSLRNKLVAEGKTEPKYHFNSRPNFVEAEAIQRVLYLAQITGARVHIFHISTKEGVDLLLKAKQENQNITGETCPHYLLLDKTAYSKPAAYLYLASPPFRDNADRQRLLKRIVDGTISNIVTDHCEFSRESKGLGKLTFNKVLNGIPGIETSLGLMHELLVNQNKLPYSHLVELLSTNAARIFGLYPKKGTITIGADADLVLFDPRKEFLVTPDNLHYNIDWNPYNDTKVTGWPRTTISRGNVIVDDGEFLGKKGQGRFLVRSTTFLGNN